MCTCMCVAVIQKENEQTTKYTNEINIKEEEAEELENIKKKRMLKRNNTNEKKHTSERK